jgi:hypothetical protein
LSLVEGGDTVYGDWILPAKAEMQTAAAHGAGSHLEWGMDSIGAFWPWASESQGTKGWRVNYAYGTTKTALKNSWLLFNCRRYAGPTALTATAVSKSQIDLAWVDNADSETGFVLERSLDQANWSPISLDVDAESFSDTGLTANTTYHYRVRATGAVTDSPDSNVASAKTKRN